MTQRIFIIGFMLFAIFFGAGNLIFPIKLGWMAGEYFWPAIIGFLVTGVGMPLLGIIAGSLFPQGIPEQLNNKVSKLFSVIFMVAIYLTIGPMFAIPRTATVSYEISFVPFFGDSAKTLFIFSILYFACVLYLSLKPSRMVDAVGKYLTPTLLISITALCVVAFFKLDTAIITLQPELQGKSILSEGFLFGYQTMDTIASVAFAIVVLTAVQSSGITKNTGLFKYCCYSGIIAGIGLGLVYLNLGWIGNHHPIAPDVLANLVAENRNIGAYLLGSTAQITFGVYGPILVALIVFLACLTTAIGLVVAVSGYFFNKYSKIKYEYYVIIFTLISFILSNQGLENVIKGSVPVLSILYPITIVIISLIFIDKAFCISKLAYQIPIYVTSAISILTVINPNLVQFLPFSEHSFGWIAPAIISLAIALVVNPVINKISLKNS